MKELILDTETTGLEPPEHRLIEIGILEMNNRVLTGKTFHFFINPERDVPNEAYRIHGISSEYLKDKPLFIDIADELLEFIADGVIVAHNAPFDLKFLNYELSRIGKPAIDVSTSIDTLLLARKKFPGKKNNLDALCKRFNVDNSNRQFHGALKDAKLLSEVYIELTGGRQLTFDVQTTIQNMQAFNNNADKDIRKKKLARSKKHIVQMPTTEEINAHRDFLTKIQEPIWEDY